MINEIEVINELFKNAFDIKLSKTINDDLVHTLYYKGMIKDFSISSLIINCHAPSLSKKDNLNIIIKTIIHQFLVFRK